MNFLKILFRKSPLLTTLAILGTFAFIVYANTFNAPFVFDDYLNIVDNPHVRMNEISADYLSELPEFHSAKRPLPNLSFALNYYFHKYDVTGYHLVNIIVHVLTAFLVFLVFRQTLFLTGQKNDLLAAAAALFWLVNPVHTQSVTYIVQRMNSMCALFYLLSLFAYIRARLDWQKTGGFRKKHLWLFSLAVFSFIAAMLSKQIAATLPVFIVLYEWFFIRDLDVKWLEKNAKWIGLGLVLLAVSIISYLHFAAMEQILKLFLKQDFTLAERLLTEPRVVVFYLSILLLPLPSRLNLEHDIAVSTSLLDPVTTLLSVITIVLLLVVAVIAARKKHKILSFAILWFFGNLVIESSVIPLALAYEHRTYLPSVFLFLAVAHYFFSAAKNHLKPAAALFAGLILLFSGLTLARNHTWADLERFHRDCLKKSSEKPRVLLNMGVFHFKDEEYEKALRYFKKAKKLERNYAKTYLKIGHAYSKINKTALAIKNLKNGLVLNPDAIEGYKTLGMVYIQLDKPDKAISQFRKALKRAPDYIPARINLGVAYGMKRQYEQALSQFRKVLELDSEHYQAYNNMGFVYEKKGEKEKAVKAFQKALDIKPDSEAAHLTLGALYLKEEKFSKAETHLLKALAVAPESYEIRKETGDLYFEQEKFEKAGKHYKKAAELHPEEPYPIVRLGIIELQGNNYKDSRKYFSEALARGGPKHFIYYYLGLCELGADNLEKGIGHLEKSLEANPGFIKARVKLADAYRAADRPDKALHAYNAVLSENKTDLHCLTRAAQIHMDQGENEKALEKFETAYQADQENQSVIQNLAFLYARFEKYGKAAEKFEALKAFVGESPLLYYNLACMYSEGGKKEKALENLALALEYGYDDKSKLMSDKNLDHIRKTREFKRLLETL